MMITFPEALGPLDTPATLVIAGTPEGPGEGASWLPMACTRLFADSDIFHNSFPNTLEFDSFIVFVNLKT